MLQLYLVLVAFTPTRTRPAHPDAVDVTSGVESFPGKKDVRDFLATAKSAISPNS
ncbi:MAG TPA: hypothetical protein VGI40_03190 [Pirellulaceae bacterium]|jgi:hypothetical protein